MKESVRTWLTEQLGEDEALFDELYRQYVSDMKKMADELNGLMSAGDLATVGVRGHAMKGMALQIGDNELAEPCKRLQDAGRAGNLSDCMALVPRICALVTAL